MKRLPFWVDECQVIKSQGITIRNYGSEHFFPDEKHRTGLKEVIIFCENCKKYDIPNGSVWVYDGCTSYNPVILKDDIGCGITAFIIEELIYDEKTVKDIVLALSELEVNIGRGNHFIDFTEKHPKAEWGNMIFLHSGFNENKAFPINIDQAVKAQNNASHKRINTLEKIIKRLQIKAEFYKDWTHNSVERKDDLIIYRKGAIDISKTQNEGILALNPFDGFYFYVSDWERFYGSMQHGAGKRGIAKVPMPSCVAKRKKTRGFLIDHEKVPADLYSVYNDEEYFNKKFLMDHRYIGSCRNKLVIYTD